MHAASPSPDAWPDAQALLLPAAAAAACLPPCCPTSLSGQLLGLLLPKYVPDDTLLSQSSWDGVVSNTDALVPMLRQHVIEPLLEGALALHQPSWAGWGVGVWV